MKRKQRDLRIMFALKSAAERMMNYNPSECTVEEGKEMDRALRCSDSVELSAFMVRWSFEADQQGWSTVDEIKFSRKDGHYYPDLDMDKLYREEYAVSLKARLENIMEDESRHELHKKDASHVDGVLREYLAPDDPFLTVWDAFTKKHNWPVSANTEES